MTSATTITAPPGEPTITVTRRFDAPRDLVFRAFTDPEAIPHWWGPQRYSVVVEEMDVRPGGRWRCIVSDASGAEEYRFFGEYREVVPPERIVLTSELEGAAFHAHVLTWTFEALGDQTQVTSHQRFGSIADRDEELRVGMEEGTRETWDRLARYLNTQDLAAP